MKKTFHLFSILTMVLLFCAGAETKAKTYIPAMSRDSTQSIAGAKIMLTRLDEINALDRAGLTSPEIRALRKEARQIKGGLKELHKGTYMPVGKLIVILLVPFVVFNITG